MATSSRVWRSTIDSAVRAPALSPRSTRRSASRSTSSAARRSGPAVAVRMRLAEGQSPSARARRRPSRSSFAERSELNDPRSDASPPTAWRIWRYAQLRPALRIIPGRVIVRTITAAAKRRHRAATSVERAEASLVKTAAGAEHPKAGATDGPETSGSSFGDSRTGCHESLPKHEQRRTHRNTLDATTCSARPA